MVVLKEKPEYRDVDQELFDYLERTYVNVEKKIPVTGSATSRSENRDIAPCRIRRKYSLGGIPARRGGKDAPMDAERIRKQLSKTGDSMFTFTDLNVECEGNVFMPVQALNKMRREVLEKLQDEILSGYRRNSSVPPTKEEERAPEKADLEERPEFTVFVQTKQQFEMVLGKFKMYRKLSERSYGIYLAAESFDAQEWKKLADRCHEAGVRCYLMMPRIFRKEAEQYFRKQMELLTSAGFDALGIGSMEEPDSSGKQELNFLCTSTRECIPGTTLRSGDGAVWGRPIDDPRGVKRERDPGFWCSGRDDRIRVSSDDDLRPVYQKNNAWMFRKAGDHVVKGPQGHAVPGGKPVSFLLQYDLQFCAAFLLGLSEQVTGLKPNAVRLNFTVEEPAAAGEILDAFFEEYGMSGKAAEPPVLRNQFTRGHFKRGVE